MDERFAAQTFTLTEGRHIKDDDTNVALVHEDFAKKNNLKSRRQVQVEIKYL